MNGLGTPLLFLDIDGVLNSRRWRQTFPTPRKTDLDPWCVGRIINICSITKAHIVISSSWRHHMPPEHLLSHLQRQGLPKTLIIGMTPRLFDGVEEVERGVEIEAWLREVDGLGKIAILDDKDDMGKLKEYLVQTNEDVGITDQDASRVISLLT